MNAYTDTIAAVATSPGPAGISVIRVSGPDAVSISARLFRGSDVNTMKSHTFAHGYIKDPDANIDIDEVILLVYRAPRSYTREDIIEIQAHGGQVCAQRILKALTNYGIRLAEPGEFTKRAFLNGRIDLVQAEATADLIASKTNRSAMAAIDQLEGGLSSYILTVYDSMISLASELETGIDFSEEELPDSHWPSIIKSLESILNNLRKLIDSWREGHLIRDGALVVICGRPNAGKSTLFNSMLGNDRAIINEQPGTTRDTLEEQMSLDGIVIRLVDTAGLRQSGCRIEQDGIRRAESFLNRADLLLYVIDASKGITAEDKDVISKLPPDRTLLIINKTDQQLHPPKKEPAANEPVIRCSLISNSGLEDIKQAISTKLGINEYHENPVTISSRHLHFIQNALNELNTARPMLSVNPDSNVVYIADHLRTATTQIGMLLGRTYHTDLLDSIFSNFCIGK